MITTKHLASRFSADLDTMRKFADGMSHEDSLLQPQGIEGNCLNWLIGHLTNSRNSLLRMSGFAGAQWQGVVPWEQLRTRYGNGSQPITADGPDVLKLAQLFEGLAAQQTAINEHIGNMPAEKADAEIEAIGRKLPIDHFVMYMYGHEQLHIGQMEYVRPLSGRKNP